MSMIIEIQRGNRTTIIREVDTVRLPVICFTCGEKDIADMKTIESHQGLECPNCHNSMYIANREVTWGE